MGRLKCLAALITALTVGAALGVGMAHGFGHIGWGIAGGGVVGVMAGMALRSGATVAAIVGGVLTVLTCVGVVAFEQRRRGVWPVTDETTIEQYGTGTMAAMRLGVILLPVVCVSSGLVAAIVSRLWRRMRAGGMP